MLIRELVNDVGRLTTVDTRYFIGGGTSSGCDEKASFHDFLYCSEDLFCFLMVKVWILY